MQKLQVTSPAFAEGGLIPVRHTGHGEDVSPTICLKGLAPEAKSVAILMDDLDHPIPAYSHWVIWNLPALPEIPEHLPHGESVAGFPGAMQGRGYGRHRYRGPKPPFRWLHRYRFTVYALDTTLSLPADARKRQVLQAIQGHILQQGQLTGYYQKKKDL